MNESRMIGSPAKGSGTKPLFRWQGGKQRLCKRLVSIFPAHIGHYIEPFIGAGSVFLKYRNQGFTGAAFLGDGNAAVANVHQAVAMDPGGFEQAYAPHVEHHCRNYFCELRGQDASDWTLVAKAARTVYLAKAAFHGLYRVNGEGKVVSTYGTGELSRIWLDGEHIRAVSEALHDANIRHGDFGWVEDVAQPGDLVFLDPPYVGGNVAYVAEGFGVEDHLRLRRLCGALHSKGVFFMQTNADRPYVRDLYRSFRLFAVPPAPAIGRGGVCKQPVGELIVCNFEPNCAVKEAFAVAA